MDKAVTQHAPPTERDVRRIGTLSMVGSSAEWFDFYLYGTAAALVFPTLFFPNSDPAIGVLLSFATLAVGFIARPIGGVLWGHFGDRIGRKKAFLAALACMVAGSVLIGLLPTYDSIGIWAPILLVALRVIQGLAIGGQWGGAVLLATEFAPPRKRGLYGSLPQLGVPIGLLLGNVAYFFVGKAVSPEAFHAFGWRLPFLASILVLGLALYAHRKMEETPAFAHLQEADADTDTEVVVSRSPVWDALRENWRVVLLGALVSTPINIFAYLNFTFMLDYGTRVLHLPMSGVLIGLAITAVAMIVALPLFAAVSDRIGRKPVTVIGAVGLAAWAFPAFGFANTGTLWGITVSMLVGQVINCIMYGSLAAYFAELFPSRVRYSGVSVTYQLGGLLGGLLSAPVASFLLVTFNSTIPISIHLLVFALIAVGCALALPETRGRSLDDVAEPAAGTSAVAA